MGIVGRYIDSLTDEQRDRIVENTDWFHTGNITAKCLVSCAESMSGNMSAWVRNKSVAKRYDRARRNVRSDTHRFNWFIHACKQRAAKGNNIPLTQPVEEAKVESKAIHHSTVGV